MSKRDPRKLIIESLRKNPEGLTILSVAKATGLHRHTCTKYIHELIGAGIIYQRSVGVAKLCYLKKKIETRTDENRILERLRKNRTSKSHIKLLVSVIFLTFLLSETVIIAYENSSLFNETNFSNTSPITSSSNMSDLGMLFNISENLNETTNASVEASTNQTQINESRTVEGTNGSNLTISNETTEVSIAENTTNETLFENIVEALNESLASNSTFNETLEQNETVDSSNETSIDVPEPVFDIVLEYPDSLTRGNEITLKADAVNTGGLAGNDDRARYHHHSLGRGQQNDLGHQHQGWAIVDVQEQPQQVDANAQVTSQHCRYRLG